MKCLDVLSKTIQEGIEIINILKNRDESFIKLELLRDTLRYIALAILIRYGVFRCSDIEKDIENIEKYGMRIVRRYVRNLAKEIYRVGADSTNIITEIEKDLEKKYKHIVNVYSSRIKTRVHRALSSLYEELEKVLQKRIEIVRTENIVDMIKNKDSSLFENIFNSIVSLYNEYPKSIISSLSLDQLTMKILNTVDTILNEMGKRIRKEVKVRESEVSSLIKNLKHIVKSSVSSEFSRSLKAFTAYSTTSLLYTLFDKILRYSIQLGVDVDVLKSFVNSSIIDKLHHVITSISRDFIV